jgi:methionyl-tRNA formyltransferase
MGTMSREWGARPLRVVFMGSPPFAVPSLRALVNAGCQVTLAVTQPDHPAGRGRRPTAPAAAVAATSMGIPVFQPERLRRPEAVARIQEEHPDVIVISAYGQILSRGVLDIPRLGCVNVHPSLLPRHRGPSPIPAAILAGDSVTGASIMLLDEGLDSGPVLARVQVPIADDDDAATLMPGLADTGAQLLVETLPRWASGEIQPEPQNHDEATYSKLLTRADGALDWRQPAGDLWRRVRAVVEWPQAFTSWDGKLLRILAAGYDPSGSAEPGEVVPVGARVRVPTAAAIGTGAGLILPRVVGIEGRRPTPIDAFLRGYPGLIGARLSTPSGIIDAE